MTHDDASVETGVGGQAKYDMMMVFCGNALHRQNSHQAPDPRLHITDKLIWPSKFTTSDQLTKTVIEAALLYISFANFHSYPLLSLDKCSLTHFVNWFTEKTVSCKAVMIP